jgi:hypothetical protein
VIDALSSPSKPEVGTPIEETYLSASRKCKTVLSSGVESLSLKAAHIARVKTAFPAFDLPKHILTPCF